MTTYVLHHADTDGRFAAYCAWRNFKEHGIGSSARYIEVQYNQPFPVDIETLTKEDNVFVLDFSYDRATLDCVHKRVGFLKVLDHHETAKEQLAGAPYAFFDESKSGALLAWEYFFPEQEPPLACLLANDFDLWEWKYSATAAFEAWVRFDNVGSNWEKWHELCTESHVVQACLQKGQVLHEQNDRMLESFMRNPDNVMKGVYFVPNGRLTGKTYDYAIHNGMGVMHSQLGGKIVRHFNVDFSIGYRVKNDIVVFNIRSRDESRMSAKQFASIYGGGGHPNASGFRLPLVEGLALVEKLLCP